MSVLPGAAFVTLFLGTAAALVYFAARAMRFAIASVDWPTTNGFVHECEVITSPGYRGESRRLDVRYSYEVDGQTYEGKNVEAGSYGANSAGYYDWLSAASTVCVHYDPADPQQSALVPGVTDHHRLLVWVATGLVTIAVSVMLMWCLSVVRPDTVLLENLIAR